MLRCVKSFCCAAAEFFQLPDLPVIVDTKMFSPYDKRANFTQN
jgi:hypothetical protein